MGLHLYFGFEILTPQGFELEPVPIVLGRSTEEPGGCGGDGVVLKNGRRRGGMLLRALDYSTREVSQTIVRALHA